MNLETTSEKMTDFEFALQLIGHINNPCSTMINNKSYDIRDFYLRLAKEKLPTLKDVNARNMLKDVVEIYEN